MPAAETVLADRQVQPAFVPGGGQGVGDVAQIAGPAQALPGVEEAGQPVDLGLREGGAEQPRRAQPREEGRPHEGSGHVGLTGVRVEGERRRIGTAATSRRG